LSTLDRRPVPSVEEVSESLARAGCPVFESWLAFHVQFGGYVEVIGNETAVWGLMTSDPSWMESNAVTVEHARSEWFVACADVHPSYDDRLNSRGEFIGLGGGGPYENFAIKVERDSLFQVASVDRTWRIEFELSERVSRIHELLSIDPGVERIAEASDKYSSFYQGKDIIATARDGRFTDVTVGERLSVTFASSVASGLAPGNRDRDPSRPRLPPPRSPHR
jgi:hypothetical protein